LAPLKTRELRPIVQHDVVASVSIVQLDKGMQALIDTEFASEVGRHAWYAHKTREGFHYATTTVRSLDGRRVLLSLHSFVWRLARKQDAAILDHESRNRLDCRISNLRPATHTQNSANARINKNNRSGYRGVHFHKKANRWIANIRFYRRRRWLGTFDNPEAAARVYDAWALAVFGEFAALNFPETGRAP
jgi:hypothetical protein